MSPAWPAWCRVDGTFASQRHRACLGTGRHGKQRPRAGTWNRKGDLPPGAVAGHPATHLVRRDVTGDVDDTDPGVGEAGDGDLLTRIRAEHERVGPGAIAPVVGDPDVVEQACGPFRRRVRPG